MTIDKAQEPEHFRSRPEEEEQSLGGPQARALRIQAIIMQSKGGMTRQELEEYADELVAEGLLDDMDSKT
jgi:hypothetical protein